MFFDGWDDDDRLIPRAFQLIKKIRELRSRNLITISEGNELKIYENELAHIQSTCSHSFRTYLLLNRHRRFCRLCDREDFGYVHHD